MSHIVGGIARPRHAAERQQLQRILFRLALGLLHQRVERPRRLLRIRRVAQLVSEVFGKLAQAVELLRIRILVDTIDEGRILRLAFFSDIFRHAAVGQQHELLDEPVALLALFLDHIQRLAGLVHDDFHLGPLERDGSLLETLPAQDGSQFVQRLDLFGERALFRLDDLLGLLVVEALVRVDDGAAEPLADDLGLGVELEYGAEGELVLVRTERTELVREVFGQHGDGPVHQVDRGAAGKRFLVDHGARRHIVRDIGNVDAHLDVAVLEPAVRKRIVKILGVGRVDGERGHTAEIATPGQVFRHDGVGDLVGRLFHLSFKAVRQLVLRQDGVHFRIVFTGHAQHIHDAAQRLGAALGPVGHQHGDLHAVRGFLAADFRQLFRIMHVNADVIGHVFALDDGPDLTSADHQHADMGFRAAMDDLDYFPLQAAAFQAGLDAPLRHGDLHKVPVERKMQLPHRNEHVIFQTLRFHETEAVTRERDSPFKLLQAPGAPFRRPDRFLPAPGQALCPFERAFTRLRGIFFLFGTLSIRNSHIIPYFCHFKLYLQK